MSLLETWVETPLAGAIGWTLLHSLWEGAIVAIALATALILLRSARARYAAALLAMLVMLGTFGFTLARMTPEGTAGLAAAAAPPIPEWTARVLADAVNPSNSRLSAVVPWLAPLWIAGVWIFSLRQLLGWISVIRLRRRGVCSAPEHWQQALGRLRAQLGTLRPVLLLESCLVDAPIVLGHLRPLILTPIGLLAGLPAEQVEAILLHELAHIRRNDYLVNLLQRFVEALLFYHPAVWWISRVIRAERENCCDDVVVAKTSKAYEYAAALAALEQNRWSGREPAVAATGGSLVKRIHRLLYPKHAVRVWSPLSGAVMLTVVVAVTLAAWQPVPAQQSSDAQQQGANTTPYMKWLNEDVVYITTDAEQVAFRKLTTDEERDKFIEQFWLRRDPTPSTPENEAKEEHYRRIAYANERFRQSGKSGWRTDRGHMYIVYGPPDEIESHPDGRAPIRYPFEMWKYWYIEGIGNNVMFTFIDRTRTGDYRLAPGSAR